MIIETLNGKVNYFVVQYETFLNDNWQVVVRYDNARGFFHRDVLNHKGDKEKQLINISYLNDALNYSQQDLKDRWEFYKERYLKHLKK